MSVTAITEIRQWTDNIMKEIHSDMMQPFPWGKQIPWDVGVFNKLHDYCDANTYLLDFIPQDNLSWDDYTEICDLISDMISGRLAGEAYWLHTCPTCYQDLEAIGPFDGTEASSGVSYGHEGFGETFQCPRGHWFTLLLGKMIPAVHILTVIEIS